MGLLDITEHERAEFARKDTLERAQQQADEQYAADLQARYDSIESDFVPILKAEIAAENQTTRVTARNRKDFAKFKQWCEEADYPYLPADPAPVLEFLGGQVEYGSQYVARLVNAIDTLHVATGFSSPCGYVLIRALLRLLRNEKDQNNKPQQKDTD
jgi:hypothetical protein